MRLLVMLALAFAFTVGTISARDIVYQPIDTNKLVVQPSKAAASLAAQTIQLAGNTAAQTIEKDGFVKTINNLFRSRTKVVTPTQPGGLPQPYVFPSTQYKSYNAPQAPIMMPTRR